MRNVRRLLLQKQTLRLKKDKGKTMANGEFTDKVKILIKAGNGGDGMNSFKAFKGKPACGPDGGDGGRGGDVYFVGDKDMSDLFSFRFTSKFFAEDGERGGTNQ